MEWKTLQHNGILIPPEYEPQGIKIKIKGETVDLTPIQEEMAYQWAKKKDTPYAQDAVFRKNFTLDFVSALDPKFKDTKYEDIDFSQAYRVVDLEKDRRDMMTKEDRKELAKERKEKREELKEKYGKAVMDGIEVEVGNYMAEPPGIFIGRGEHPLRGKWKTRITEKDVTLNLGKDAKIPDGDWAKIENNTKAMWLANWIDGLTQKRKYVWLADTANI
ncbi:MAG: DNA topoisomerase I, partial [Thaumarchaeota archaeon]|nr:DNA topoisomerase I [Nitrososphaerota archaeon]